MIYRGKGYIGRCLLQLAAFLLVLSFAAPASAENYISVNGGLFSQGSDYRDDYDEPGLAGGLSFILVNQYAGFEFGLSGYTSHSDTYDEDVSSLGLELLVHFHKTDTRIQPFIAFGLAKYRTTIEDPSISVSYDGSGAVVKGGARLYLSKSIFVGAYIKWLVNEVDISSYTFDLGGTFLYGEIGIVRF